MLVYVRCTNLQNVNGSDSRVSIIVKNNKYDSKTNKIGVEEELHSNSNTKLPKLYKIFNS